MLGNLNLNQDPNLENCPYTSQNPFRIIKPPCQPDLARYGFLTVYDGITDEEAFGSEPVVP